MLSWSFIQFSHLQFIKFVKATGVHPLHIFSSLFQRYWLHQSHLYDVRPGQGSAGEGGVSLGLESALVVSRVLERTSETGFDRNTPPRLGYTLSPPRLADKLLNIWIDRQQNPPPYVFDFLVIVNVEKGGLCLNI